MSRWGIDATERMPDPSDDETFNNGMVKLMEKVYREHPADLNWFQGYDDLRLALANVRVPTSLAPAWTTFGDFEVLAFGSGSADEIYFDVQIPHGMDVSKGMEYHVHWMPSTTATGSVIWQLTYELVNRCDSFTGTGSVISATHNIAVGGEQYKHIYFDIGDINTDSSTLSAIMLCKLERLGGTDTYGGNAYYLSSDFHVFYESMGSQLETEKRRRI